MLLTIFTPTYNRSKCLMRLYNSLCQQTDSRFEWVIVDDGSTDNTRSLVRQWMDEAIVHIRYFYQKNSGKSMAHNQGVRLCKTEFFVCVDSDDWLTNNAVSVVLAAAEKLSPIHTGLLMPRRFIDEKSRFIQTLMPHVDSCTLYDAYEHYGMQGDTMLVFKTSILKQFEFPCFEGEKFIPESYLYNLIDCVGPLKVLCTAVYNCEYQNDGYTNNVALLLKKNPRGYIVCVNQRLQLMDKTLWTKFRDSARYVSMMFVLNPRRILNDAVYPIFTILALPIGWWVYRKKYKIIK